MDNTVDNPPFSFQPPSLAVCHPSASVLVRPYTPIHIVWWFHCSLSTALTPSAPAVLTLYRICQSSLLILPWHQAMCRCCCVGHAVCCCCCVSQAICHHTHICLIVYIDLHTHPFDGVVYKRFPPPASRIIFYLIAHYLWIAVSLLLTFVSHSLSLFPFLPSYCGPLWVLTVYSGWVWTEPADDLYSCTTITVHCLTIALHYTSGSTPVGLSLSILYCSPWVEPSG